MNSVDTVFLWTENLHYNRCVNVNDRLLKRIPFATNWTLHICIHQTLAISTSADRSIKTYDCEKHTGVCHTLQRPFACMHAHLYRPNLLHVMFQTDRFEKYIINAPNKQMCHRKLSFHTLTIGNVSNHVLPVLFSFFFFSLIKTIK